MIFFSKNFTIIKSRRIYIVNFLLILAAIMIFTICLQGHSQMRVAGLFKASTGSKELKSRLSGPLEPSDEELLKYTYEKFLVPPSTKPYNLSLMKTDPASQNYNTWALVEVSYNYLHRIMRKLYPEDSDTRGFFVEAGAYDGERNSNTLYLELFLGWTGLLVEPDDQSFDTLLSKNRRTWACQCCLSAKPFPYQTILTSITRVKKFTVSKLFTSLMESRDSDTRKNWGYPVYKSVQCLPLQTLLFALKQTHVDLVSLDVEDMEFPVLEFFPMDEISVDIWLVEHRTKSNVFFTQDVKDENFIKWFESKGYLLYDVSEHSPRDYVFIRRNSTFLQKNRKRLGLD